MSMNSRRFTRFLHGGALLALVMILSFVPMTAAMADQVSIHDIQSTVDEYGNSLYENQQVTISGTVTAAFYNGYTVAEAPGPWAGIFVYSNIGAAEIGDDVVVTGWVTEYYGMTEIVSVSDYQCLASGRTVEATVVGPMEASQEQYESVLVTVENVIVGGIFDYGQWAVGASLTDYIICDDTNDYLYFPKMDDFLESITGVVTYSYGNYVLEPRATADVAVPDPAMHYALRGHVVTMNDDRDVLRNHYVEILGDEIVAIHRRRPHDIPVIRTRGLIFPGLIDSHNHPSYNVLGTIPFPTLFNERSEWQSHPMYDEFYYQLGGIMHHGGTYAQWLNVMKLAEIRALTAGTTSIQGNNCNGDGDAPFAKQGVVINNVERFPARVVHKPFPLLEEPDDWAAMQVENWDRFVIHLSEGTTPAALDEFYAWQDLGMLDWRTTIIHGIPYGESEWSAMGEAGANLIWSPTSNLRLYGETTDIPGALAAGVNVALSPDWTESGSRHLLDELKAAAWLNWTQWGGVITPLQFAEFVTRNAAVAVGSEDLVGQVAPGFRANLMVIPGSVMFPYRSLLRARPARVRLTVVDGKPLYGDPWLMNKFGLGDEMETVTVGGRTKGMAIRLDAPTIEESGKSCNEILAELQAAYDAAEPKLCEFVGLD